MQEECPMDNNIDRQDNVVLVIGATGNQGGAAARHLLADGWRVRALVRDSAAPKAVALAAGGAELIHGDLTDEASLRKAVAGAHGDRPLRRDHPGQWSTHRPVVASRGRSFRRPDQRLSAVDHLSSHKRRPVFGLV
jgi:NAD(P)-dependent dehydrogenase (short-subunit alcohol dehydrogenase family)